MGLLTPPKKQWHHKRAQLYQLKMKCSPTRAERRFDDILDEALKSDKSLPIFKATQSKKTRWDRKKRKFKKQKIFEFSQLKKAYIVDFYIPGLRLVIEIDGTSHDKSESYDNARTRALNTRGIKVIRFTNNETLDHDTCLNRLVQEIETRKQEIPTVSISNYKHYQLSKDTNKAMDKAYQDYIKHGGTITKC